MCDIEELPTVLGGYFNCSGYIYGDVCNLICNAGYYVSSFNQTVCEEKDNGKGDWKDGNYNCTGKSEASSFSKMGFLSGSY